MAYCSFENSERDSDITSQMGNILNELGKASGEDRMMITSYLRTPEQQATIMLDQYSTQRMCNLYNNKRFCEIRTKYNRKKVDTTGDPTAEVNRHDIWYQDLLKEIAEQVKKGKFDHVHLHSLDIAPSSIKNQDNFEKCLEQFLKQRKISKYLSPKNSPDKAYHIVFNQ